MHDDLGAFVIGILCFLAIVLAAIVAVATAFFNWLNRRSGQDRQTVVHTEARAVQEDYEKAATRATLAFSEQKLDANFAGIVICQQCGHAITRSSGICGSCGTPINQG